MRVKEEDMLARGARVDDGRPGMEECPICFTFLDVGLNTTVCCSQRTLPCA